MLNPSGFDATRAEIIKVSLGVTNESLDITAIPVQLPSGSVTTYNYSNIYDYSLEKKYGFSRPRGDFNLKKKAKISNAVYTFEADSIESKTVYKANDKKPDDIIKFWFRSIVDNEFYVFRAIVDGDIVENITAAFDRVYFLGRPDSFITYQNSARNVNLQTMISISSKAQLQELKTKLNRTTGMAFGKYAPTTQIMQPNLFEFTFGDLYKNQPVLISNITYTFPTYG